MRRVYVGFALIGANAGLLIADVWFVLFGPRPLLSAAFVVVGGIGVSLAIYGTRHALRVAKS